MEYISAEEFLKQPKEVQKVFIDWWKPSEGDLVNKMVYVHNIKCNKVGCIDYEWWGDIQDCINRGEIEEDEIKQFVFDYIADFPLLTEGQIRKFIEDKTNTTIESYQNVYKQYSLMLVNREDEEYSLYESRKEDLLQAYWKVACEIAKEANLNEQKN